MDSKKCCTKCKKSKNLIFFSKTKTGHKSQCKSCRVEITKKYYKTLGGVISAIYNIQIKNSKKRNMSLPNYTKKELRVWLFNNDFIKIYENWMDSGYKSNLKPSVDRLDDYKSYSFDNIRLVTWGENNKKGNLDRKNGLNCIQIKPVNQYTINGEFINRFISINQASRLTGVAPASISRNFKGKQKQAGGFLWKLADEPTINSGNLEELNR